MITMTLSKFQQKILEICSKPRTPKQIFKEVMKDKPYSYDHVSRTIMVLKDMGRLKRINGKGVVYVAKAT